MKSKPALNTIDDQAMKDSFIGSVKMPQKKIKKKEMKKRKQNINQFNMLYQISPNFVMQTLKQTDLNTNVLEYDQSPKINDKSRKFSHKRGPLGTNTLNTSSDDGLNNFSVKSTRNQLAIDTQFNSL